MFHILDGQQFDRETLDHQFALAQEMSKIRVSGGSEILRGKILVSLFYEPSTRTRLSFESAMLRLGGNVISTENAREFSSAVKGETIEDTARNVSGYGDVLVIRHHQTGSVSRAATAVERDIPIINAGDGSGQHPTQALVDLYTIRKEIGEIDGLTIAMVGDLKYGRTVRSLAKILCLYPIKKIYFVAHQVVRIGEDIKTYLSQHNVAFEESDNLAEIAKKVDVIYMTRIQKERFGWHWLQYRQAKGKFRITPEIASSMQIHARILHPLPRVDEIAKEVDSDQRAAYFRQSHNGVDVRMALLHTLLIPGWGCS